MFVASFPTPLNQILTKYTHTQIHSPVELLELQRARRKAKKEAAKQRTAALPSPHPPLAVPSKLRPRDRIGMGGGGGKKGGEGVGGGPGRFAAHVVKVGVYVCGWMNGWIGPRRFTHMRIDSLVDMHRLWPSSALRSAVAAAAATG